MINWTSVETAMPEFAPDVSLPGVSRAKDLLIWIPRYGACRGEAVKFQDGEITWSASNICGTLVATHWVKVNEP